MRCTIVFTVLLSVLSVAPLYGDDGLFSEVAMESVFQTSTSRTPTASKDLSGSVDRVTSVVAPVLLGSGTLSVLPSLVCPFTAVGEGVRS